jgi:uncharacterized RDD family membrane protein YckC
VTIAPEETRVSGRRYVAHLVDGVILAIILVVAVLIVGALPKSTAADALLVLVVLGWFTVGHIAYFVLLQRRHGRTPGKALVGIRVIDAAGATPDSGALVKRTLPLLIEYFYVIAFIGMMSSHYRQRFGDRWAKTYVVID